MNNPEPKEIEDNVEPFSYEILRTFKLPIPATPLPVRFDKVINSRKSVRKFKGLTKQQISDILWYSSKAKITYLQENGYILTHRGVPSAGARHPIDIIVSDHNLFNGGYFNYYNPFQHSLNQLIISKSLITRFLNHINDIIDTTNATIIWFVAHPNRTSAKYKHADSLIWRDAGALLNSIQLICTALGINSCPVGSLGEPYISDFFNSQSGIFGAGGLVIG